MADSDTDRKSTQIPERTHSLLKWLSTKTGQSIGSLLARAVDVYIKHRTAKGQWVPTKRDLRRKP